MLECLVCLLYYRMPKGRLAPVTQKWGTRLVDSSSVTRRSAREKMPTEKGSSYTASLRSSKHKQQHVDNEQPGPSRGKTKATAGASRQQGKTSSDKDSEEEVVSDQESEHSDDELSAILARAKVAMSVIDKLADKLKTKSKLSNQTSKTSTVQRSKSADKDKKRAHSRDASVRVNTTNNDQFQRVPLFPELEDGELPDDADDDSENDDVVLNDDSDLQQGRGNKRPRLDTHGKTGLGRGRARTRTRDPGVRNRSRSPSGT